MKLRCDDGLQQDGALCYQSCESLGLEGYNGIGPVCWKGSMSATRGSGKSMSMHCDEGKELIGLLCYDRCRQGYHPSSAFMCYDDRC